MHDMSNCSVFYSLSGRPMPNPHIPRKRPAQSRSRATREAILEAAARILEHHPGGPFTTNHIAETAGVSIGSLYQYFPGKEAILAELVRAMRKEMLEDFEAALAAKDGDDLAASVNAGLRASLKHHLARPALARALEEAEAHLPLDVEIQAIKSRMHQLATNLLRDNGVPEPAQTAFDIIAIARGMADAATHHGEADLDGLFRRIRRAIFGYLGRDAINVPS